MSQEAGTESGTLGRELKVGNVLFESQQLVQT